MRWSIVATALVALLSGCSSTPGGESTAGSPSAVDGTAPVDQTLINAVAPSSAETLKADNALRNRIEVSTRPERAECLRAQGFHDAADELLAASTEPDDPGRFFDFPDVDQLRSDYAFGVVANAQPSTLEEFMNPTVTPAGAAAAECHTRAMEQPKVREMMDRLTALDGLWILEMRRINELDDVQAEHERMMECLRDLGVPAEGTESESVYLGYVDSVVIPAPDDQRHALERQHARWYADCGEPLFDLREQHRREAQKAFAEKHAEALAELAARLP